VGDILVPNTLLDYDKYQNCRTSPGGDDPELTECLY